MNAELYIKSSGLLTGKLDFFKDEKVTYISASIDDLDFQKQTAPFTKSFTIPASANNNSLLQMFGQVDMTDGINPHKKISAMMLIEQTLQVNGYIELSGFIYKQGEITQYQIGFFEEKFNLKAQLADYRLIDIDLSNYEFTLTIANVESSWALTLNSGKVLVPVMAHVHDYIYQPDAVEYDVRNIAPLNVQLVEESGVQLQDLKPAYHLRKFIVDMLENTFFKALGFDYTVVFDSDISQYLDYVYFVPSKDAGAYLDYLEQRDYLTEGANTALDISAGAGNPVLITLPTISHDPNTAWNTTNHYYTAYLNGTYTFQFTMDITGGTGSGYFTVRARNRTTQVYYPNADFIINWSGGFGTIELFLLDAEQVEFVVDKDVSWTSSVTNLRLDMQTTSTPISYYNNTIDPLYMMPDVSCHDFLRNFLDTFNLIIVNREVATVKQLYIVDRMTYYKDGSVHDLSKYIDYSNRTYNKLQVDDRVVLEYEDAEDKQNAAFNQVAKRDFGEISVYFDTDFATEDKDSKSLFTLFPPAVLDIINTKGLPEDTPTNINLHSQFDFEEKEVNSDFLLMYYRGKRTTNDYNIQDGVAVADNSPTFKTASLFPDVAFDFTAAYSLSYSLENSLFGTPRPSTNYAKYFADWLALLQDPDARKVSVEGFIPVDVNLSIEPNDTITINGIRHIIKKISYDWGTTKTKFELMKVDLNIQAVKPSSVDNLGDITFNKTPAHSDLRTWSARDRGSSNWLWNMAGKSYNVQRTISKTITSKAGQTNLMRFRGTYNETAFAPFFKDDVIQDNGWLMIANQETFDKPAPQKTSEPFWASGLGATPGWSTATPTVNIQYTGSRYTFANDGYISDFRVWIPAVAATRQYQIITVKDPTGTPIVNYYPFFIPSATGWYAANIGSNIVKAGDIMDIFLAVKDTTTSSTWNSTWNYMTPKTATAPKAGEISQSADYKKYISVHKTDNTATDQSANLATVAIGDTLNIGATTWEILTVTDNTTYITYEVTPVLQDAASGSQTATFKVFTASAISYVYITNHYVANPDVSGLITTTDILSPTVDNNGYGVDIEIQEADISDEYKFLSYTDF